jgi:hypothetical protein
VELYIKTIGLAHPGTFGSGTFEANAAIRMSFVSLILLHTTAVEFGDEFRLAFAAVSIGSST